MKIKKLIAENFKSYDKLVFEPNKVTYAIVGRNGAGKTSMQQAIRYALTGDLPDNAVKTGSDELSVDVILDSGEDFSRTKSLTKAAKTRLNGKTTTGKLLAEHLEEITGVPMDAIRLSSSAELVENLKPEALGEFLMRYTPEELTTPIVESYMGPVDPDVKKMLESYLPLGTTFGYEKVSQVYTQIFEQRKAFRKSLDERLARVNAFKGERPPQTMDDVNRQLEAILKKEGATDSLRLSIKTYQNAVKTREMQEKNIAELEAQIAANTATRPVASTINDIKAKKQALNNEIIALTTTLRTMESNLEVFKSTLENLNSKFCPLSERLCCTTDKTPLKKEFEEQIEATNLGIAEQKKLIEAKKAELPALNAQEAQYNENCVRYNTKITLTQQLEKRKTELIQVPEKPATLSVDTEEIEEKKKELYAMRDRILAWQKHEEDEAQAAVLAKRWKVADILCGLLRPNGVVSSSIVGYYLDVFEELCNETLAKINKDYELRFVADKGVRIECKTKPGMKFVPYESASSGERACVIFAIMDLISRELANLKIMVLDDLDKLDKTTFESLISFIMQPEIQDLYDHIIICAVDHEDTVNVLSSYADIELNMI